MHIQLALFVVYTAKSIFGTINRSQVYQNLEPSKMRPWQDARSGRRYRNQHTAAGLHGPDRNTPVFEQFGQPALRWQKLTEDTRRHHRRRRLMKHGTRVVVTSSRRVTTANNLPRRLPDRSRYARKPFRVQASSFDNSGESDGIKWPLKNRRIMSLDISVPLN